MEADYDDKFVLRYAGLEQKFEELQEETEEVALRLKRIKRIKEILQAEVSFLQRRVKMLKENAVTDEGIKEFFATNATGESSTWSTEATKLSIGCSSKPVSAEEGPEITRLPPLAHPSKNQEIVGVLKSSSLKHGLNGFSQPKSRGKRKISWQDGVIKV